MSGRVIFELFGCRNTMKLSSLDQDISKKPRNGLLSVNGRIDSKVAALSVSTSIIVSFHCRAIFLDQDPTTLLRNS